MNNVSRNKRTSIRSLMPYLGFALHSNVSFMIRFPDLKAELFVNMLGYKEPDRVTVLRCVGECQTGQ